MAEESRANGNVRSASVQSSCGRKEKLIYTARTVLELNH